MINRVPGKKLECYSHKTISIRRINGEIPTIKSSFAFYITDNWAPPEKRLKT